MIIPKISIITPSYNQGCFLEDTILSVLGQNYPNLEYIIIDGGSTDNSVEIINKYKEKLAYWISEPDQGQSHAINKGFAKATGDIIAWLNSDDMYMPNILSFVAGNFENNFDGVLFGECVHFRNENGTFTAHGSNVLKRSKESVLTMVDFIVQPSTFWTKNIWQIVGQLDQSSHFGFDWEWFLRAQKLNVRFKAICKPLSIYRIHDKHKSGSGGLKRQAELLKIYNMYDPSYAAVIYSKLLTESLICNNIFFKGLYRILEVFKVYNSFSNSLKILKPLKYLNYANKDIETISTML
jgi:glycosyltransferase involved in cell wall biosynthesis